LITFSIQALRNVNATLDPEPTKAESDPKKTPKKAKWHLGIRSQSKPQDIMNEVFKAMKASKMVCDLIFSKSKYL